MRLFQPYLRPRLVFNGPPAAGGSVDRNTLSDEDFLAQLGFPRNTATDDMTDAQKAAYWRDKSKGFQKDSETKARELEQWKGLGEFDAVSTTIQTAEQQRQAALTESQRAQEAAQRAEQDARAAGEAAGRATYLGAAIEGKLVALTIRPGEKAEDATARVKAALEFADTARFLDDQGSIDESRIATFAQSIGQPADGGTGGDVLAALYQRQQAPAPGSGGSVSDVRARTRERLNPTKQ